MIDDLRGYIDRLAEEGEAQPIEKEVDWQLEMGAVIRRSYDLKAPAPFFQKLKGYPQGYRAFGAPIGTSSKPHRYHARLALSLGLQADASATDIIEEFIRFKQRTIKPTVVSGGPCKENIHVGPEVDLEEFPVPFLHDGDGGRYIGTWHLVATKDPDTGWVNWGMYRLMIQDKRRMGILLSPYQDIGLQYYGKYEARNRPMEFAVAMGTEPVTPLVAALKIPPQISEVDVVGGIRGAPLEVVKCETVDLTVPATSEIVIEGEITPHERMDEGPFGEYTGYRAGEKAPRPVCHVKAITHRHNPILPVSCMGVPVDDDAALRPLSSALILEDLRNRGFPVGMVFSPPEASAHFRIISSKVPFAHYAKHLAFAIWGSPAGKHDHYLIVVDEDIDVTNFDEVLWAFSTRLHPDRGIFKVPNAPGGVLMPFLNSYEKAHHLGAHVLFDCTWPKEWPEEAIPVKASFDVMWPREVQERVLQNWREYGYKD